MIRVIRGLLAWLTGAQVCAHRWYRLVVGEYAYGWRCVYCAAEYRHEHPWHISLPLEPRLDIVDAYER